MNAAGGTIRVFFPCTGLGREQRGFESFTRDCASALRRFHDIEVTVFGGGRDLHAGERETWNLPRSGVSARALASLFGRDPYFIEQASFFGGFLGALVTQAPDVVYFGDVNLGNACWHWRRFSGQKYRLLYYNGGPTTLPFTRCDMVQQVSPEHLESAIGRGESPLRQCLLPHGVSMAREYSPPSAAERAEIRLSLGVPLDCQLVLSVGALNATHKRLDYVIDEVATMASRPHLLLIGAETSESRAIRDRAAERLGGRCTVRTLSREATRRAYRAADVFVLASLVEGFGLVQVEALDAGLPCVAHNSATASFVLGGQGMTTDLRYAGALAPLLERALHEKTSNARQRHDSAYERFSWDVLGADYAELLRSTAAGRAPVFQSPLAAAPALWTRPGEFDEAWKERIAQMAALIRVPGVVADFGCGMMWLEGLLSPANTYLPIDYVRRDDRTLVLDLNRDALDRVSAEVAFLSGVMEYVEDLEGFVARLKRRGFRQIVASYCTLDDHPDRAARRALNWKSDASWADLMRYFGPEYSLESRDTRRGDVVFSLTRSV